MYSSYIEISITAMLVVPLFTAALKWLSKRAPSLVEAIFCSTCVGLIVSLTTLYSFKEFPIQGTSFEKLIVDNIIELEYTPYVLANILLSITGVTAMYLVQSKNVRTQRWASVLGLLGQPLWFYIAITNEAGGIVFMSILYTLVWGKGFFTHWVSPYLEVRKLQKEFIGVFRGSKLPETGEKGFAYIVVSDDSSMTKHIWDGIKYQSLVQD